jgi:hypothetical protein
MQIRDPLKHVTLEGCQDQSEGDVEQNGKHNVVEV